MVGKWLRLSEQQKLQMVEDYESGLTSPKVARKHGISGESCQKVLREYGVLKTKGDAHRKNMLDGNYFDSIDSEEKAWILGFIFADGCNTGKNIKITLARKDRCVLEQIASCLYGDQKVIRDGHSTTRGKMFENSTLAICHERITKRLEQLGVSRRKSLTLQFPTEISRSLLSHFIRGYFDGDGCIHIDRHNRGVVAIIASIAFTHELNNVLRSDAGLKYTRTKDKGKMRCVEFNAESDVIRFYHYLYDDANIYMKRKKDIFDEYVGLRMVLSMGRKAGRRLLD